MKSSLPLTEIKRSEEIQGKFDVFNIKWTLAEENKKGKHVDRSIYEFKQYMFVKLKLLTSATLFS